jgi:hypothetical protein
MFFGIVVGKVEYAWSPKNRNCPCCMRSTSQQNRMSMLLDFFCFTVLFIIPDAVLLSVRSGVPSFG